MRKKWRLTNSTVTLRVGWAVPTPFKVAKPSLFREIRVGTGWPGQSAACPGAYRGTAYRPLPRPPVECRNRSSFRPSSGVFVGICCLLAGPAISAEPARLTTDGKLKLSPVFTAEGAQIVYSVHGEPTLVSLMRLNLADGSQKKVHPVAAAHQFDAAYSADGRYHCYAMSATSPQMVLVIQDLIEGTESQFRPQGGRASVRRPTIAPDSSHVVFGISAEGGHQIASVDMQGRSFKKLTESAGWNIHPAYSPDGRQIAFSSSRDEDFEIYVMNADGSDLRRLTHSARRDLRPSWSPDGGRIAFTSARDGNYEVYAMNVDGSHVQKITDHPDSDDFPAWHPDGKHVVTVSLRGGKFDLYLFEVPSSR